MILKRDFLPLYRDAEADGLLGLRAYMSYFMDNASEFMYRLGKGNDTLPEQYGIVWVYSKYRMKVFRKSDFSSDMHVETWCSKADKLRVDMDVEYTKDGQLLACGRVESCLLHLEKQSLAKPEEIELPNDIVLDRHVDIPAFSRFPRKAEDSESLFAHTIPYSEIDKSHHMFNLAYIPMFLNTHTPEFWQEHEIHDFELHYMNQARFNETLNICRVPSENGEGFAALKQDGSIAARCVFGF